MLAVGRRQRLLGQLNRRDGGGCRRWLVGFDVHGFVGRRIGSVDGRLALVVPLHVLQEIGVVLDGVVATVATVALLGAVQIKMGFELPLHLEAGRALGTLEPFQRLRIVVRRRRLGRHLVLVFRLVQVQLLVLRQIVLGLDGVDAEAAAERAVATVQRDVVLQRFAVRIESSRTQRAIGPSLFGSDGSLTGFHLRFLPAGQIYRPFLLVRTAVGLDGQNARLRMLFRRAVMFHQHLIHQISCQLQI